MPPFNLSLFRNFFSTAKGLVCRYFSGVSLNVGALSFRKLKLDKQKSVLQPSAISSPKNTLVGVPRLTKHRSFLRSSHDSSNSSIRQNKFKRIRKGRISHKKKHETLFDNELSVTECRFIDEDGRSLSSINARSSLANEMDENEKKEIKDLIGLPETQQRQLDSQLQLKKAPSAPVVHYISSQLCQPNRSVQYPPNKPNKKSITKQEKPEVSPFAKKKITEANSSKQSAQCSNSEMKISRPINANLLIDKKLDQIWEQKEEDLDDSLLQMVSEEAEEQKKYKRKSFRKVEKKENKKVSVEES